MCEYCKNDGYYNRNKSLISKRLKNNVDIDLSINVKDRKLEDMEIDKILQEHDNEINDLLALVPKDLKAGEELETTCPNCGAKLRIAKVSINGHLWITCEKEGVLICQ